MKRCIFIALIACITFVMPMTVNAAEAYAALSNDNTTLTFYYDNEKSSRNGMDIGPFASEKERGWNYYSKEITTVIFDESFVQYTDLQSTANWFRSFTYLTSIIGIENLKTSNVIDMSGMFAGCQSLLSIDLTGFDTQNVKNMERMFRNCRSLQSIDLRNFDTRNVENMERLFEECLALESIDLSSFNTEKVTTMASMFENCYQSLAHINVSSFNTSNVTDMSKMFESCYALKVLDLSSFNTFNVTNMRSMFSENSALTTIYVSDKWSTTKVENGKGVFSKCNSLVGGSGTTWDENHTDYTYARIDGGPNNPGYLTLKTDDIPDINTDKVEAYAALSNDNTTLTFYYDDKKSSRNGMDIGPFERARDRGWNDYRETISTVVFDNSFQQYNDLTSTSLWFEYCRSLTEIKGIENLQTSNVIDMSGMFDECFSLLSLDLSTFETQNVKDMQGMFAGCKKLMSLDVGNFNTENVTNMRSMFEGCEILENLNINNFCITNVVRINNMFEDCYALTVLDLSSFDTSNVIKMDEMFNDCIALTTIYVSDKWTTAKVEDGNSMFDGCISLVGGKGTTYDKNHTDHTYAHIDGGEKNPGYLTYYKDDVSPKKEGDVTGDGTVSATDIVELVNYIIGNLSNTSDEKAADVNGDGVVNVADIMKIITTIMGAE